MKTTYVQTKWIDNKTPVNAANLNRIESAIGDLYNNALSYSQINQGEGITVRATSDKGVEISVADDVLTSRGGNLKGIDYIMCDPNCPCAQENGVLYFALDPETKLLKYILLNGVKIWEVK